ncbi:MAG TPA: FAD-binding oxidoreductase [Rubrivivax sp.]|nr:FAD-binding oxidoreductase [Rubrivivax sp.]
MSASASWGQYRYRVGSSARVTPVIRELWLSPVEGAIAYRAGQYVLLGDTEWRIPQRAYSLANAARRDGRVSLLVTAVAGGVTSTWAHGLREGDEALLEGPFGTFGTDAAAPGRTAAVLLLGAGADPAPVRALAQGLLEAQPGRRVTLLFSCRTQADLIGDEALEALQRRHRGFRYQRTLTRDPTAPLHGRIPARLAEVVGHLAGWEVYAAGPSGFVVDCAASARALGAAAPDIHTEELFVDPQPWSDAAPAPATG